MGKLFKEYYSRLAKEGFLKALLGGLIVGASVAFVAAFTFWFVGAKQYWISLILLVASAAAATPIFYYKKFRPSTKAIAKRLDELGLEERMLTMTQLEGDDSYIAMRQREDAIKAMSMLNPKLVKMVISASAFVTLSVTSVCGLGMTTVSGLSAEGILPSGKELIAEMFDDDSDADMFDLTYGVQTNSKGEAGGVLEGKSSQRVEAGADGETIIAVPEEDWIFVEWSDGVTDAARTDENVSGHIEVYAIFEKMGEDEDDAEDEFVGNDRPMEFKDGPGNPDSDLPPLPPNPDNNHGGSYTPADKVLDNATNYKDILPQSKDDVQEDLNEGGYDDDLKDLIDGYINGL